MKYKQPKSIILILLLTVGINLTLIPIGITQSNQHPLPPPTYPDMILEETIFRRMSIREFTNESISDEDLSTILWAAYGLRNDGTHTVPGLQNSHAAIIYVLKEDAAYTYEPDNHSLTLYKSGDYRDIVGWQYHAPIQLGLCWDTTKTTHNFAAVELAQIGQNIQFCANALNLGTVVTAQIPPAIQPLGLPANHMGMVVMPLGHPKYPYNFMNKPRVISSLPRIIFSNTSFASAVRTYNLTTSFTGTISDQQQSQLIWSSYGYSYYLDESNNVIGRLDRHRTIPSAHGYYPLRMYAATETGIYRYIPSVYNPVYGLLRGIWFLPVISFLIKVHSGDYRAEIADLSSQPAVATAPLILISVVDIDDTNRWDDLSGDDVRFLWYYDAGSSAQNMVLESAAWGLHVNLFDVVDKQGMCSLLRVQSARFDPLLIVAISE